MDRQEIIAKLKDIMVFAMPDSADAINACTESSDLRTDLGLNSVGLLYIVIAIEESFGVDLSGADFSDFNTVKDVIDYIQENL